MIKPYAVHGEGSNRLLEIYADKTHLYRFYKYVEGKKTRIKLTRVGARCYAIVPDKILVFTKPRSSDFHKEVMKHNARSLWLGLVPNFSRLEENMLEFYEII